MLTQRQQGDGVVAHAQGRGDFSRGEIDDGDGVVGSEAAVGDVEMTVPHRHAVGIAADGNFGRERSCGGLVDGDGIPVQVAYVARPVCVEDDVPRTGALRTADARDDVAGFEIHDFDAMRVVDHDPELPVMYGETVPHVAERTSGRRTEHALVHLVGIR